MTRDVDVPGVTTLSVNLATAGSDRGDDDDQVLLTHAHAFR